MSKDNSGGKDRQARMQDTRRQADAALSKEYDNPYPLAKGQVYLRVNIMVYDDAHNYLDTFSRTYEHRPIAAKAQFEALKAALMHTAPDGPAVSDDPRPM